MVVSPFAIRQRYTPMEMWWFVCSYLNKDYSLEQVYYWRGKSQLRPTYSNGKTGIARRYSFADILAIAYYAECPPGVRLLFNSHINKLRNAIQRYENSDYLYYFCLGMNGKYLITQKIVIQEPGVWVLNLSELIERGKKILIEAALCRQLR